MTTSSTNLDLTLFNNSTDQSGSFLSWTSTMSGSANSNMTKIDDWAGSVSGSITAIDSAISGSMATINNQITNISGSIATINSDISTLNLRFKKFFEFGGAGKVDWNNIPQTHKHLLIVGVAQVNTNMAITTSVVIDFNGDANNANYTDMGWLNVATPGFEQIGQGDDTGGIPIGWVPPYAGVPSAGKPVFAIIPNYSVNGGFNKTAMGFSAWSNGVYFSALGGLASGTWNSNVPITRIRISGVLYTSTRYNFTAGTMFSLYGFG